MLSRVIVVAWGISMLENQEIYGNLGLLGDIGKDEESVIFIHEILAANG